MKKSIVVLSCLLTASAIIHAQDSKEKKPSPPPPPKVEVVRFTPPVIISDEDLADFYKRNPLVSAINWKSTQDVVITFKDKEKNAESYNLANEDEEKAFREKYGDIPKQLPPPPPPPPVPKKNKIRAS